MTTNTLKREEAELHAAVGSLLSEAVDEGIGRRRLQREPYFRKVLIQPDSARLELTGFTRDISNEGVGLLHAFALNPKDKVVVILEPAARIRLPVEIVWCTPLGDGWYVSGGQFVTRLDS